MFVTTRNPPASFQTAREDRESRTYLPTSLPQVPGHRILLCRYQVDRRHWGPGRRNPPLPLGTAHPDAPDLYCVQSDTIERQIDNVLWFTRLFASIPDSWDSSASAVLPLPAFDAAPTYATATTITATRLLDRRLGTWRLTAASHGLTAGDIAHISLRVSVPTSTSWFGAGLASLNYTGTAQAAWSADYQIRAHTSDTVDVTLGPASDAFGVISQITLVFGSIRKLTAGLTRRPETTRNVPITIRRDYFLPGLTDSIPTREAIPLPAPFAIQAGTQDPFEENTLTASTVPTAAQYRAMIDSRTALVLESTLEDYLGPILCRRTASYLAQ